MGSDAVLVVEDDLDIRAMICWVLDDALGVTTLEAADGLEALAIAREAEPALVLLDIGLPLLDGLAVVRHLKSDPATRQIPVIAVTAQGRHESLEAGCDDYVGKPFEVDHLLRKVARYLAHPAEVSSPSAPARTGGDRAA